MGEGGSGAYFPMESCVAYHKPLGFYLDGILYQNIFGVFKSTTC